MAGLLISGPAGASKSQAARAALEAATEPTIAADFQSIVAALLLLERDGDGNFPPRPDWVLPIAEYTRRAVISASRTREIGIVATNSDGDPARRAFLLSELGPDASETILDPSEAVVRARLTDPVTGVLSNPCADAVGRWYGRRGGGRGGGRRR